MEGGGRIDDWESFDESLRVNGDGITSVICCQICEEEEEEEEEPRVVRELCHMRSSIVRLS